MPGPLRHLTLQGAKDLIAATVLEPAGACNKIGLEYEAFPSAPHHVVVAALADVDLPGASRVTFEPGGQVELSGPCFPTAAEACTALRADLEAVAAAGIALDATGIHPHAGTRPRVLDTPRYRAMEAYFDGHGPDGRRMMRDTAAFQINVDAAGERRWRLLHALAPVLAAAFANSPAEGWKSARLRAWLAIDPTRTAPVGGTGPAAWVAYALRAKVMFIRSSPDTYHPVDRTLTLAEWIEQGHDLGFPTEDDVAYHLTTLFPPVRPRQWLELRFLDALPDPWWQVAAAATSALLDDPEIAERACLAHDTARLWPEAARYGVAHPVLGAAAHACLKAVPEAAAFVERFTARGRCPADDATVAAWA
jgi:glutamate--cysteine ligase